MRTFRKPRKVRQRQLWWCRHKTSKLCQPPKSAQGLSGIIGLAWGLPWAALNFARKQLPFIVVNPHFNLFPYPAIGAFLQSRFQSLNLGPDDCQLSR
jgi:hypothetical protein